LVAIEVLAAATQLNTSAGGWVAHEVTSLPPMDTVTQATGRV